jgi:hypothetical protein
MSSIQLQGNSSGTGVMTVSSPNTNTNYTITLPEANTTLVGTDATQTLTNKTITDAISLEVDGNVFLCTTSGSAGIGTTVPNANAQTTIKAAGTYTYQLQLEQSNTTDGYGLRCAAADGCLTFDRYASSAYSEFMRLDTVGRLIIGANTARAGPSKLEVRGPANTELSIYMFKETQVEMNMGFKTSNDTNFYIGTTGTAVGATGVYLTNGGSTWNSVSDERMKTIVKPIDNASEKVASLRTVIGYYNNDATKTPHPFLFAQDVEKVLPEAVNVQDQETGILGMSYTDTIPLLVAAIKEQQELITSLTLRIEALETKG